MRSARRRWGSRVCRDRQWFRHDHYHDYHAVHADDTVYHAHDSEHDHPSASLSAGRVGVGLGFVLVTNGLTVAGGALPAPSAITSRTVYWATGGEVLRPRGTSKSPTC